MNPEFTKMQFYLALSMLESLAPSRIRLSLFQTSTRFRKPTTYKQHHPNMPAAYDLTDCVSNHLFPADPPPDEPDCPICREDWQSSDGPGQQIVSTECNHIFHCDCLVEWLSGGHRTCPSCRRVLYNGHSSSEGENYQHVILFEPEDVSGQYEISEVSHYFEDETGTEETAPSGPDQYHDCNLYLDAGPILEELVIEAVQQLDLARRTFEERFMFNVQPVIDYVVPRFREKYRGLLWDPLPRQPVPIDDSALECRILTAMITVCNMVHPHNYVGTPITPHQYTTLCHEEHARRRASGTSWDEDERRFVEHGLLRCSLRMCDFFSRRPRDEVPVRSFVTEWHSLTTRVEEDLWELGEDVVDYFDSELDTGDLRGLLNPVRDLFVRMMAAPSDFLERVEIKEEGRIGRIVFGSRSGWAAMVSFWYRTGWYIDEFFEPSLFGLGEG
ncbi:hypothetical protein K458DRAFT_471843 [Lentithecium fluviatile CBS 122367]|uniref:RING-type domain-containing protein n=1 Tax=Lentithecium fluviatile CBS 122367 TaxID=1168545 RepID=A0A6G1J6Z7_9PLEO|nr:hypothetical protein K458DRAFT_471843 [Lentithecium fluviatile CBS 122367]